MNKHRLYVDEVGNSDLRSADNPNHRFLSLTGVIFELEYVANILFPEIESLKQRYFGSHPDNPIIFHRKKLVNKKYPFHALRDPNTEQSFNAELLSLLNTLQYTVITVVIDKKEHRDIYTTWQYDPYHYCLAVLLERFIFFLETHNILGDVMAESRGGAEDRRLKKSYKFLYEHGTEYVDSTRFQHALTSCELKVKPKLNNISGLQIADLIAHPSRRAILRSKGKIINERSIFGDKIEAILQRKYYKSYTGKVWGYGKKLLP
jgi:hypothetical protein